MRLMRMYLAVGVLLLGAAAAQAASSEAIKRNNFGAELSKQGRLEEAVAELRLAIQADPAYATAHLNLAYAYDRLGRTDEAVASYQKVIALDPKSAAAFNNLGVLYTKKGKYDEAIQLLEEALKLDPANATLKKNLENAKSNREVLQEQEARIAEARKQTEARPKDPRAAYNLSRAYASSHMKDEALEWLDKALQLGFDDIRFAREDPALTDLRGDPRFARLLERR